MPLYKGGERGLSVWQDLTDTYQTLTFQSKIQSRVENVINIAESAMTFIIMVS